MRKVINEQWLFAQDLDIFFATQAPMLTSFQEIERDQFKNWWFQRSEIYEIFNLRIRF